MSPFPNFYVYDKKDHTKDYADWANDEVSDSKKWILSTKPWCCCEYHSLSSIEWGHWICCMQKKHNCCHPLLFQKAAENNTHKIVEHQNMTTKYCASCLTLFLENDQHRCISSHLILTKLAPDMSKKSILYCHQHNLTISHYCLLLFNLYYNLLYLHY